LSQNTVYLISDIAKINKLADVFAIFNLWNIIAHVFPLSLNKYELSETAKSGSDRYRRVMWFFWTNS